jgi:hypothetical protein
MLRKFANMFVDLGPEPPPTVKEPSPKATQTPIPVSSQPISVAPSIVPRAPVIIPGQIDPEMMKILEDAIEASNIPGFDYIEFRAVLKNMETIQMPEPQRFQAAFASAQVNQVTKQQLLEAIDFYLKVIDNKSTEFVEYVTGLQTTEVNGKDTRIAELDQMIASDAAKIQELTASINQRRQEQDALRMEKARADLDIRNKAAAFTCTKDAVVARLTNDRNKIDSYIQ